MKRLIIITGVNKGLGKAFYNFFTADKDCFIISISRNLSSEQQKDLNNKNKFGYLKPNFDEAKNISFLSALLKYKDNFEKVLFINNAATIHPIGAIGELDSTELTNSINVNVIFPALTINYILKTFENQTIDVINISSGAAIRPVEGWAAYCSSKAYMHFFMQALDMQVKNDPRVNVYNVDPGVIDTDMQQTIRDSKDAAFTRHDDFVKMKTEGKLADADTVALRVLKQTNQL